VGTIIYGGKDTAEEKIKTWKENGIRVLNRPDIFGAEIRKQIQHWKYQEIIKTAE
jgi:hypothetical protein